MASAAPPPSRRPRFTCEESRPTGSAPDQDPRDRRQQPARPSDLAADDCRRLDRPGLEQLEVLEILPKVDAQNLRRHQHGEPGARQREDAEHRGRPLARPNAMATTVRPTENEPPRGSSAGRPRATSASRPSRRTRPPPAPSARASNRSPAHFRRRPSYGLLASALRGFLAASWNASSLGNTQATTATRTTAPARSRRGTRPASARTAGAPAP